MSPKADVSAERKNQITEAAIAVFSRRGFKDATIDDIVAESGLSKGALYWYYKSKDEIIGAILEYFFRREFADLRGLLQAPGSAREHLRQVIQSIIAEIQRMKPLLPIFYEFYALALRNKTVRKALERYFREYLAILTPLIQQGIDRGEFCSVNAEQVALAAGSAIEGTLLLWVLDPKAFRLEPQLEFGMELVLAGLARPGRSTA
jgi:AcrR family transcriptional regulator